MVVLVVVAAFIFLLTNGLHDASSVLATMIACGAATPLQAVVLAACLGLAGTMLGGTAVADTMVKLMHLPAAGPLLTNVLLAALLAAIGWNLLTWQMAMPSSSTHALVGGIIGSVWMAAGAENIAWGWSAALAGDGLGGIVKVVAGLLISPVLGFCAAFFLQKTLALLLRNARFGINRWLKAGQWLLVALLAFSHGANDTQKVIGLVSVIMLSGGALEDGVQNLPFLLRLAGGAVMFIGTMLGGWSIIKTLGSDIYALRPLHSFNSQLVSAAALLLGTSAGAPISTTQLVAGTVLGVGAAEEYRMVKWQVGKEMVMAWFVTLPAVALLAALLYKVLASIYALANV